MLHQTLAHYKITAHLGAGGMGEVYRAHYTKLGRDVALKILPQSHASDPNRRARLEREARAAAALRHNGIVTVYAFEEAGTVSDVFSLGVLLTELSTQVWAQPYDRVLEDVFTLLL